MKFRGKLIVLLFVALSALGETTLSLGNDDQAEHLGQTDDDGFVAIFDGQTHLTDRSETGRLDHGAIALQIHDKGMQVEFADIRLKRLTMTGGTSVEPGELGTEAPLQRAKFLLLDSRIVANTRNAKLTVGTVQKHTSNPLFKEDKPWEPRFDNVYANVIYDEQEQLYKCWYSPFVIDSAHTSTPPENRTPGTYMKTLRATGGHREMGVCYATSKDGIGWTKPLMNIRRWKEDQPTNIVDIGPHGSGIMKDLREDDPERLYKMFMKENGVSVEFSPDGLDWSDPITADAAGGSIRVNAIDVEGNKLATSQTITDDVTDRAVIFPDGFKLIGRGNSLRIRFEIRSARLYSFSI